MAVFRFQFFHDITFRYFGNGAANIVTAIIFKLVPFPAKKVLRRFNVFARINVADSGVAFYFFWGDHNF